MDRETLTVRAEPLPARSGTVVPVTIVVVAAILLVAGLVDHLWVGNHYQLVPYDNDTGWFAIGIGQQSGAPLTNFHHPSFFFNILAGGLVGTVDLDGSERPFEAFLTIAWVLQLVFVLVVAVVAARLVSRGQVTFTGCVLATMAAAAMPTAIIFSGHYSNYFVLIVLALVIGMYLSVWMAGDDDALAPVAGLVGFASANFFPILTLPVCLIAVLLIEATLRPPTGSRQHLSRTLIERCGLAAATGGTVFVMAYQLALLPEDFPVLAHGAIAVMAIAAALVMIGFGWFVEHAAPAIWRSAWWLLAGWWIGALWLAPYYGTSLLFLVEPVFERVFHVPLVSLSGLVIVAVAGGIGLGVCAVLMVFASRLPRWVGLGLAFLPLVAAALSLYALREPLTVTPWLWLCVIPVAVYAVLLVRTQSARSPSGRTSDLELRPASVIGLGLAFTLTAAILHGEFDRGHPGLSNRTLIGMVAILAAAVCYADARLNLGRFARAALVLAVAGLSGASLFTTSSGAKAVVDRNAAIARDVDAQIERFLAEEPDGTVVCARDEALSRMCTVAYAHNSYRSEESRKLLPTRWLFDGRVLWLSKAELEETPVPYLAERRGPILIVGKRDRLKRHGNADLLRNLPDGDAEIVIYPLLPGDSSSKP